VPFRSYRWDGEKIAVGSEDPKPELRQVGPSSFVLMKGFCYRVAEGDREGGTVYVIPGEDADRDTRTRHTVTTDDPPQKAVIPPTDEGGRTDLSSVPWWLWWLIASYGNHTRASLLHDALYLDKREEAPVPRATADRLFLTALREPGPKKGGVFRHWLMWTAVSLFGNLNRFLGVGCAVQVVAVWILGVAAVAWAWGPTLAWDWWQIVLVVAAVPAFLIALGTSWRAGVDLTGGWLCPTLLLLAAVAVPLLLAWPSPFELGWSPFTLLFVATILMLLGPAWGFAVDPTLRGWLWPTATIGLPIALIPVGLIFFSSLLVWFIDFGAALAKSRRRAPDGSRQAFERPPLRPGRVAL
jgi:hypothetical protein